MPTELDIQNDIIEFNNYRLKEKINKYNANLLSKFTDTEIPISPNFHNLSGKIFNKLHVDYYAGKINDKIYYWCTCECGNRIIALTASLKNGTTKSCGCIRSSSQLMHGFSIHPKYEPLYKRWIAMNDRCYNPNNKEYNSYGMRGITVCDEWKRTDDYNGLKNFIVWAICESNYAPGLTIDRKNNDFGYSPDNCWWTNHSMQNSNRTITHYVQIGTYIFPLSIWAKISGISLQIVSDRIRRSHWNVQNAIFTPIGQTPTGKIPIIVVPEEYEKYNKYSEWIKNNIIQKEIGVPIKDFPYMTNYKLSNRRKK